jgi:hypothetical protein
LYCRIRWVETILFFPRTCKRWGYDTSTLLAPLFNFLFLLAGAGGNDNDKELVVIVVDDDGDVEDTDDEDDNDLSSSYILFSKMKFHIIGSAIL